VKAELHDFSNFLIFCSLPDLEELAVEQSRPTWFLPILHQLFARTTLDEGLLFQAFRDLISGSVGDAHASAFLAALRMKGESGPEIAVAAEVLREQMIRLVPTSGPILDTCGPGGNETTTFNISTATALVIAACGVPIVKHGNRAVSSRTGSADVLAELGVAIESGPDWAQRCLDRVGFAFCFAPHYHAGMKNVAKLRRSLGFRTIFNLTGPLANPASAEYQMIGTGNPELLESLTAAIATLGTRRTVLVSGQDGLGEVTLAAPTLVRVVEGNTYHSLVWTPGDFGLEPVQIADIQSDGPVSSAKIIRSVLNAEPTAALRIVLANAAAGLWTMGNVENLKEGVEQARIAIQIGKALAVLEQLVAIR
jgi:anthranilate phosphoribosyltransferase